jgi:hypothetical protein
MLCTQVDDWIEVKREALEEAELGTSQQEVASLIKKHGGYSLICGHYST